MTWEAGWRYGIISTIPYEQQKIYRQIILFQRIYYLSISLTGLPCHRETSIVLMSMTTHRKKKTIQVHIECRNLVLKKNLSKNTGSALWTATLRVNSHGRLHLAVG